MSGAISWAERLRASCVVFLCTLLTACALPKAPIQSTTDNTYIRIGRFALRVETTNDTQNAVQGGFVWRDDGHAQQLDLANPLGSTLARVEISRDGARLTRASGERLWAANPEVLVAQALGSSIPVTGLRDWLRGRSDLTQVVGVRPDAAGHPAYFVQDGWQVWLSRYDAQGPRLLRMERQKPGEIIKLRLVID